MLTLSKFIQATKPILNLRIAASFQTTAFNPASLEEKLGLPPRPKRPLTPYFRYMKEMRPVVIKENPNLGALDIIRAIAEKYKSVEPAQMRRFEAEYAKENEEYLKKKFVYESKLTPEQKQTIMDAKEELVERKKKIAYKKRLRENNKPVRPPTAFLRFISDARDKIPRDPSKSYLEWQKVVAEKWKALSDLQKQAYMDAANADFAKYKQELAKWEIKMVRLGNTDLVRDEAVIEKSPEKPKRRTNTKKIPLSSDSD